MAFKVVETQSFQDGFKTRNKAEEWAQVNLQEDEDNGWYVVCENCYSKSCEGCDYFEDVKTEAEQKTGGIKMGNKTESKAEGVSFRKVERGENGYKETKRKVLSYLQNQEYEFSEEWFKKKVYAVAVAEKDGNIVGSLCLKRLSSTLTELGYLYTVSEFRHKGIARELTNLIKPSVSTPFCVAITKEPFMVDVFGESIAQGINEETGNNLHLANIPL